MIETFSEGFIPGFIHTYVGEEAVAAGVCVNLRDEDYIAGTHRGHGHCIAKGVSPSRMMAEMMGKETGTNKGKGGSMHSVDCTKGILGSNGIVASGIPIITGAALSIKLRKTDQVAVAFFGDGASNRGAFHEAINLAGVWQLPAIFVCEDNNWAISVPKHRSTRVKNFVDRAQGYGIPGIQVDGSDVIAVSEAVTGAIARACNGGGPTLIVCDTPRMRGHEEGDPQEYRPKEDIASAKARDPINKHVAYLKQEGLLTEESYKKMDDDITREMANAVEFGKASSWPAPETALDDLFAEVE
jgi:TPP-dependent pyruvate/acetoin dehydrogenase alpha subunit